MFLNSFFRLEMVQSDHNHHPRTPNAPFRAARHPRVQNNKTGPIHVRTPVSVGTIKLCFQKIQIQENKQTPQKNQQETKTKEQNRRTKEERGWLK